MDKFERHIKRMQELREVYEVGTGQHNILSMLINECEEELHQPLIRVPLPSDDFLQKLFKNNSDCYADTWSQDGLGAPMVEGESIQAMTSEQFIKVVKSIWQWP